MTIDAQALQQAELRMWTDELEAVDANGRPDWAKRRIAGERVCELLGIADVIKAVTAGGALEVPPTWPEVACRPVGGGPGFLRVEVSTLYNERPLRIPMRLAALGRKGGYGEQIGAAIERGKWQLRKLIETIGG